MLVIMRELVRESTPLGDAIYPPETPRPLITRDSNVSEQDSSESLPEPVAPAVQPPVSSTTPIRRYPTRVRQAPQRL